MNQFLKAEKIVNQGLGLLLRELILPRLVQRYDKADFVGAKDDTIKISIPSLLAGREYEWRTRTNPIVVDELKETNISVTLDKHVYSAVGITDEELSLDIKSWGTQVARPQLRAVGEKLEGYVASSMEGADFAHTVEFDPDLDDVDDRAFWKAAVSARKYLNVENVPITDRFIILGANAEEAALQSKHLVDANTSGWTGTLSEAIIGRIAGFWVIGSVNSIDPDFAMAFHPTAFALANLAPEVPDGVSKGAIEQFEGLAMRWIKDYDSDYLRDRSVYSSFAGTQSVEDQRNMDVDDEDFAELTGKNARAVEIAYGGS